MRHFGMIKVPELDNWFGGNQDGCCQWEITFSSNIMSPRHEKTCFFLWHFCVKRCADFTRKTVSYFDQIRSLMMAAEQCKVAFLFKMDAYRLCTKYQLFLDKNYKKSQILSKIYILNLFSNILIKCSLPQYGPSYQELLGTFFW